MRTTLNIEDDLLAKAQRVSGLKERTAVVREGLKALIERERARRRARLGGTEPQLRRVPRRPVQSGMILVDSSIWIDHLRAGKPALAELLNAGRVLTHPFVVGELACGNLKNPSRFCPCCRIYPLLPSPKMRKCCISLKGAD